MSSTYSEKLKDPRWQRKRTEVLNRDDFTCRDCDDKTKTLHVHHCFYEKGAPWETDAKYLLTVCDGCHKRRQKLEDKIRRAVGVLVARMGHREDDGELSEFAESLHEIATNPDAEYPKVIPLSFYELMAAACLRDLRRGSK